jgi:predicted 2-oxoglutarate/Fe(II)-dependent dioxygenase YbiX
MRYYAQAGGRPALLVFADEACVARLDALAEGLAAIGEEDLTVHVVGPPALAGHDLRFPLLQDPDGRAAGAYRTGGAPTAFLLDPNLRVRATLPFADGARVAADVAKLVAELVWDDRRPREITTQAPLLVVPDVLDPERCAELIAVWEQQGHSQTGVETARGGGRAEQLNVQLKRRRDHVVQDPQRSRELASRIGRRVLPELSKAFAYRASRFEGFKIACYQASDGGFFSAHRDNLSPATAHRRFALTLNLNDGYQGGQLRFPEYGPERYRPAAGAGLLFSCSHLHEVLAVTAGRRFVLLSFLFGEQAPRRE